MSFKVEASEGPTLRTSLEYLTTPGLGRVNDTFIVLAQETTWLAGSSKDEDFERISFHLSQRELMSFVPLLLQ